MALQLGLAKLQRPDPREGSVTFHFIAELAEQTEQSIAVAVWGNLGPTIVRLETSKARGRVEPSEGARA